MNKRNATCYLAIFKQVFLLRIADQAIIEGTVSGSTFSRQGSSIDWSGLTYPRDSISGGTGEFL